jgi:hypothetical protein
MTGGVACVSGVTGITGITGGVACGSSVFVITKRGWIVWRAVDRASVARNRGHSRDAQSSQKPPAGDDRDKHEYRRAGDSRYQEGSPARRRERAIRSLSGPFATIALHCAPHALRALHASGTNPARDSPLARENRVARSLLVKTSKRPASDRNDPGGDNAR